MADDRRYALPKGTAQPKSFMDDDGNKMMFGKCGVFDVYVTSVDPPPFHVPVGNYLEEILYGLQCAPEPPTRPQSGLGSRVEKHRPDWEVGGNKAKHSRLRRITRMQCLQDACQALFWIALGVVTNRVCGPSLVQLRSKLANAWGLVVLEVGQQVNRDMEAQDWVLGALPAILVQTIFRLFVDCFPRERSQFQQHADPFLNKLSKLVAYEVCGFQRDAETCLKERRQLFKKVVLDRPSLNQLDTVKAQMRKEVLEQRILAPSPLNFGTLIDEGGEPLEDMQLEHVMTCREMELKNQQEKASQSPGGPDVPVASQVPPELSIERYDKFSEQSAEIFQRQFQELLPKSTLEPLEERPVSQESASSRRQTASRERIGTPSADRPSSTTTKGAKHIRLLRAHTRKSQVGFRMMNTASKKEQEAAERRKIEDRLKKKIVEDPLPKELCERSLDTSWVSPITDRLLPSERDRRALRKPDSDSFKLKMAPISQKDLPPILSGTQSAPELDSWGVRFQTAMKKSDLQNSALPSIGRGGTGGRSEDMAATWSDPFRKNLRESLVLEPPPSLESKVVIERLEAQRVTMQANSFGVYSKNFEITSGARKRAMDPAAVRRAETAYVSSMQELVGAPEEPALKMFDSPAQKVKRRFRKGSVQK